MAVNLQSLAPITTGASALSNLILVSPQSTHGYQPLAADLTSKNPPSLLFHTEGEQTADMESDITDHYVEDNTARQDHIALRPEIVTTHGFIGELNDVPPPALAILKAAADRLTSLSAYAPQLSATALIAYNEAFLLYQTAANVANAAISAWQTVGNVLSGSDGQNVVGSQGLSSFNASTGAVAPAQNRQQTAFQQLYGYWRARTLFRVQTPWAVFDNMAILRLRAVQDAETDEITDFDVTFKMIRKASTLTSGLLAAVSGRLGSQSAGETNMGTQSPSALSSYADSLTGMGL